MTSRFILLVLVVSLSSCTLISRKFEVVKTATKVDDENYQVYFYTQENLTELSKSRIIQFRCQYEGAKETFHGSVYIDPELFELNDDRLDPFGNGAYRIRERTYINGKYRADIAVFMKGYKYVAVLPKKQLAQITVGELDCYVIGVTKAPVPFPYSNTIKITVETTE